tara:strand:- start:466 stop:1512 length:1047 start_codon:yes stop_codon:yes gene_type:complete
MKDFEKKYYKYKIKYLYSKIKQNKYGGMNYTIEDMINRRLDHLSYERSKRIESEKNINNLLILGINHRIEKTLIGYIQHFDQKSTKVITETELESSDNIINIISKILYIVYLKDIQTMFYSKNGQDINAKNIIYTTLGLLRDTDYNWNYDGDSNYLLNYLDKKNRKFGDFYETLIDKPEELEIIFDFDIIFDMLFYILNFLLEKENNPVINNVYNKILDFYKIELGIDNDSLNLPNTFKIQNLKKYSNEQKSNLNNKIISLIDKEIRENILWKNTINKIVNNDDNIIIAIGTSHISSFTEMIKNTNLRNYKTNIQNIDHSKNSKNIKEMEEKTISDFQNIIYPFISQK